MNLRIEAGVLLFFVNTNELFECAEKHERIQKDPELRDIVFFILVTGYEPMIRYLFTSGLASVILPDYALGELKRVDRFEVRVSNHRSQTFFIKPHDVKF